MEEISRKTYKDYIKEAVSLTKQLRFFSLCKDYHYMAYLGNVLQEAETKFVQDKSDLSTWKYRWIKFELIKKLKSKCNDKLRFCGVLSKIKQKESIRTFVSTESNQYNILLAKEIIDFVNKSFDTQQKQIFQMFFVDRWRKLDIAKELGVSKQFIFNQIDKIKSKIKGKFHD